MLGRNLANEPSKLFPADRVDAAAAALAEGDEDGWRYVPRHDPAGNGFAVIDIFDEDGEKIATY